MLEIISNGSKFYGQKPDTIDQLIRVLEATPLDPCFEKYGTFVQPNPHFLKKEAQQKYAGCTHFHGNFHQVSHSFNIITDEPETIEKLTAAIQGNINSHAYKQAKKEYKAWKKEQEQARLEQIRKLRVN